ncbi:MAG: MFS transporter, partial [Acidimicrobiaceae bacterium]|nr:MFS transporter [Acidimicrobiaceae bacterium]
MGHAELVDLHERVVGAVHRGLVLGEDAAAGIVVDVGRRPLGLGRLGGRRLLGGFGFFGVGGLGGGRLRGVGRLSRGRGLPVLRVDGHRHLPAAGGGHKGQCENDYKRGAQSCGHLVIPPSLRDMTFERHRRSAEASVSPAGPAYTSQAIGRAPLRGDYCLRTNRTAAVRSEPARGPMADNSTELNGPEPTAAELAAAILDEEAKRRAEQVERDAETVLPDDLLPGVGGESMTLRQGLRVGGTSMVVMMFVLNLLDELPRAIRVLAPDIQKSLDVSDTVLFGILGFGGVALVLGAVPMAALADRVKRVAIIPVASAFWGVTTFLSGLIVNPFQLFLTNAGTGLGQAYRIPVSNSLLVDTYPIQARSRIFALEGLGRPLGQLLGPLAVGGFAALVGGDDAWRTAFFAVAAAPLVVAVVSALVLREPERGYYEKRAVFGEEQVEVEELPVSIGTAFARLRKIKTFYFLSTGVGVLGFALIAIPIQFNLLLEDKYAMGPFQRGVVESCIWVAALVGLPFAGRIFDRGFRRDPAAMMRMAGLLVMASGVVYAVALPIKILGGLVVMMALAQTLISMAFVAAPSVIAAVSP